MPLNLHLAKGSTIMRLVRFLVLTALGGFCKCISGAKLQIVNLAFYDSHSGYLVSPFGEFWPA